VPRISRWLLAVTVALAGVLALTACAGDDDDSQSATSGEEGGAGGGGGGIPDGGSGAEAPGAPINIPDFQLELGQPLNEMLGRIEADLVAQCGGELCVEIVVESSDEGFTECEFVSTEPAAGEQIERGGTLVVIAGSQPCDDEGDDGDDSGDDSGDDGSGNSGDSTDDTGEQSGDDTPDDGADDSGDSDGSNDGTDDSSPSGESP
jgi:hypothetical protein